MNNQRCCVCVTRSNKDHQQQPMSTNTTTTTSAVSTSSNVPNPFVRVLPSILSRIQQTGSMSLSSIEILRVPFGLHLPLSSSGQIFFDMCRALCVYANERPNGALIERVSHVDWERLVVGCVRRFCRKRYRKVRLTRGCQDVIRIFVALNAFGTLRRFRLFLFRRCRNANLYLGIVPTLLGRFFIKLGRND